MLCIGQGSGGREVVVWRANGQSLVPSSPPPLSYHIFLTNLFIILYFRIFFSPRFSCLSITRQCGGLNRPPH